MSRPDPVFTAKSNAIVGRWEDRDAWTELCRSVETMWPVHRYRDVGVVVGCSGGADSVALLRCLVETARKGEVADSSGDRGDSADHGGVSHHAAGRDAAQGFFVVAHFNHALRGRHSDADADFVRELSLDLGVEFVASQGTGVSRDEQSARQDRREFFARVLRQRGARYLALGHSLDDNVETMLYRLMRGTGPSGVAGILPFRPLSGSTDEIDFVVTRPLLNLRRHEIRQAMHSRGYLWREDQSNQSNDYQRNWIRNELIPMMQTRYPESVAAMGRAIEGQRQWQESIQVASQQWADRFIVDSNPLTILRIDVAEKNASGQFMLTSQAVVVEAMRCHWESVGWPLRAMSQTHWTALYQTISGVGESAFDLPGAIRVRRDRRSVIIDRAPDPASTNF